MSKIEMVKLSKKVCAEVMESFNHGRMLAFDEKIFKLKTEIVQELTKCYPCEVENLRVNVVFVNGENYVASPKISLEFVESLEVM